MENSDALELEYYDAFLLADLDWYEAQEQLVKSYPGLVDEGETLLQEALDKAEDLFRDAIFTGEEAIGDTAKDTTDVFTDAVFTGQNVLNDALNSAQAAYYDAFMIGDDEITKIYDEIYKGHPEAIAGATAAIDKAAQPILLIVKEEEEKVDKEYGMLLGLLLPVFEFLMAIPANLFFKLLADSLVGEE